MLEVDDCTMHDKWGDMILLESMPPTPQGEELYFGTLFVLIHGHNNSPNAEDNTSGHLHMLREEQAQ